MQGRGPPARQGHAGICPQTRQGCCVAATSRALFQGLSGPCWALLMCLAICKGAVHRWGLLGSNVHICSLCKRPLGLLICVNARATACPQTAVPDKMCSCMGFPGCACGVEGTLYMLCADRAGPCRRRRPEQAGARHAPDAPVARAHAGGHPAHRLLRLRQPAVRLVRARHLPHLPPAPARCESQPAPRPHPCTLTEPRSRTLTLPQAHALRLPGARGFACNLTVCHSGTLRGDRERIRVSKAGMGM